MHDHIATPIDNPIFIVGSGRSGTTLLRSMLNAHPRIYISHEASYYLMNPTAQSSGEWLDFYENSAPFQWMKFSRDDLAQHIPRNLPARDLPRVFDTLMRIKAGQYGKPRYGDKTPFYSWKLKKILADFPGAKVIHIVRNPAATVASLRGMPWAPRSILLLSLLLAAQTARLEKFSGRILEIRLEDLIESTGETLRKVLDFVGEPWSDQVMKHEMFAPQDDMPPFPWFEAAQKPASAATAMTGVKFPKLHDGETMLVGILTRRAFRRFNYRLAPVGISGLTSGLLHAIADLPMLCLDIGRTIAATMHMRKPRHIENLPWPNPKAWKYYPGFRMENVTEWSNSPSGRE